ncbi:MAG: hypothetical protein GXO23_06715 [Crenarchaeota archaeon]|nr:hypothetical protein [Thermoproteota archaeon]
MTILIIDRRRKAKARKIERSFTATGTAASQIIPEAAKRYPKMRSRRTTIANILKNLYKESITPFDNSLNIV